MTKVQELEKQLREARDEEQRINAAVRTQEAKRTVELREAEKVEQEPFMEAFTYLMGGDVKLAEAALKGRPAEL